MSEPSSLPTSQNCASSTASQVQPAEDGDDAMPGKTAVFYASDARKHGMAKYIHALSVRCQCALIVALSLE